MSSQRARDRATVLGIGPSTPLVALALLRLAAGGPGMVCLDPGVCTPVVRLGDGHVRHVDRLPARVDPERAFAAWMTWTAPPEPVRAGPGRTERSEWRVVLSSTRLRLSVLPGTEVVDATGKPSGLLAFLASDPLDRGRTGDAPELPEALAAAESAGLLDPDQKARVAAYRTARAAWQRRVEATWSEFVRSPREARVRAALLDALVTEPAPPSAETTLSAAQRTELRRRGHALEGRIVLEDLPGDAYRIHIEGVPLDQLVEDWNAGLRALVSRLERVPRPHLRVLPGRRHEEATLGIDVRPDVDETRMSQVARRLAAIPGLDADGTELPPPGL